MNKHLRVSAVTLAVAALAPLTAAHAQSNVTIYGVIAQSVRHINAGQSNLTFLPQPLIGNSNTWTVGPSTSSRLGFQGSEDLGDGMKASFQIEHRFMPDTGGIEPRDPAGTNAFWNAASWVSLSSRSLGEVRLGRQYVPAFYVALNGDPWLFDYNVGGAAGFTMGGNINGTAYNAVTYTTPSMGGLTSQLMVAAGEGGSSVTTAPPGRTGRNVGFNLQYNSGALYAGLGYNDFQNLGTPDRNNSYWNMTVAYDLGVVRPIFSMSQGQNNVANNAKTKTMILGATAPLGQGRLRAVLARYDAAVGQSFNAGNAANLPALSGGQNTNKLGIGYVYALSKRTSLHMDFGTAKTEGVSRSNGVEAGIRHNF